LGLLAKGTSKWLPVVVSAAGVILSEVPMLWALPKPRPPPPPPPDPPAMLGDPIVWWGGGKVVVVIVAAVWVTVVSLRFCLESEIITAVGLSLAEFLGESGKCN